MRVLIWHVHGSYLTALLQGGHTYLIPTLSDRGPNGRGRAQTWDWPTNAVEVSPAQCAESDIDVVVMQRPRELHGLAQMWMGGRRPGRDVPSIYLEHNVPQGRIDSMAHPARDRPDLLIVHVAHFNALFWDTGTTPSCVIEHGVIDPGYRYTGELDRVAVTINEPVRRGRVTGTDLLSRFCHVVPIDLFGIGTAQMGGTGNFTQIQLHEAMARRRVYLHPVRWTSLGLSLLEAMHLGMPVVALRTTEVAEALPDDAGFASNNLELLESKLRYYVENPEEALLDGKRARIAALDRFGLKRFLRDWDTALEDVAM